jgi:hypothetical protein
LKTQTQPAVFGLLVLAFTIFPVAAQEPPTMQQTEEANLNEYITLLRSDVAHAKAAILNDLMDLTPEEAVQFWPIYNQYNQTLSSINDERLAAIEMYARDYANLTNAQVTQIANTLLEGDSRRTELKKQTFERLSQATSPLLAARFLQIENQLEKIIDLQIAAHLPIVERPSGGLQ